MVPCRLAILDFFMPAMNGLEVQTQVRHIAPQTAVILCSARADARMRDIAHRNGALAFFDKPYDGEELLAAVRQAFAGGI